MKNLIFILLYLVPLGCYHHAKEENLEVVLNVNTDVFVAKEKYGVFGLWLGGAMPYHSSDYAMLLHAYPVIVLSNENWIISKNDIDRYLIMHVENNQTKRLWLTNKPYWRYKNQFKKLNIPDSLFINKTSEPNIINPYR